MLRDGRSVGEGRIEGASVRRSSGSWSGGTSRRCSRARNAGGERWSSRSRSSLDARLPRSASFELRRGEVLGIAGLMGAGRTEMVRAIFGLDPVRSGRVRVGAFVGPAAARERLRQGAGLLSEDRKREGLAAIRSVGENLTLTRLEGLGPLGLVLPRRMEAAAKTWIDSLGHPVPRPPAEGLRALGRKPAEGRARAPSLPRPRRASPRRADARHRRRKQGFRVSPHRRARLSEARPSCS